MPTRLFAFSIALLCFCQPAIQASEEYDGGNAMPTAAYAASYESLMQRASTIAKQCSAVEAGSAEHKTLIQSLQTTLTEAFDLRLMMQRQEIAETRKELDTLEKKLVERETRKKEIIESKGMELLKGNDLWATLPEAEQAKDSPRFRIQPGDILAVYIEGILPYNAPGNELTPPPITTLQSGVIVTGYPLPVAQDGSIALPLIDPVKVDGMTIREAEAAVREVYIKKDILRPEKARPMMTLVPREANRAQRNGSTTWRNGVSQDWAIFVSQLITKRREMAGRYGSSHPLVKSLDNELKQVTQLLLQQQETNPLATPIRDLLDDREQSHPDSPLR